MERAGQDGDGRFYGGIFSSQEEASGGMTPRTGNADNAEDRGNVQERQEDYVNSSISAMMGWNQGNYNYPNPSYRYQNGSDNGTRNGSYHDFRNGFRNNFRGSFCNSFRHGGYCRQCQECPKKGQFNQMMILIVAVMVMGMLFLAFLVAMLFLLCIVFRQPVVGDKSESAALYGKSEPAMPFLPNEGEGTVPVPDWSGKEPESESGSHGEYYGEIRDAVRTDLNYSIVWENYEYNGNSDTVLIAIDYPIIKGDIPNVDILNDVIAKEIDYFEEYYAEYSKYMLPEEIFAVYSEGFVTYMDEEVMSVVFNENIYTDYWTDCGLFCVNIDMENGVILDNSSILDVDDEFAVDFRTRSRVQNGDISVLEYLTDQEVAYYLTDGSTGIIFYTPLGMEIGLNYGEDYLTVTYKDYKDFLLKY